MLNELKNRISEKALTVWKIHGMIQSGIFLLVAVVATVLIFIFDWPKWIISILVVLFILGGYYSIFFSPKLKWRRWRYEIREQEIELQHGLFVVTKTLIPMVRVQHVDMEQGPILKKYGLATISISTAATTHEIPALEGEEAENVRQIISELARVAEEDV
ncbi:PH domain-containing protein [Fervidibacillus halotolerans]|uniref:PH domain-containing protein n=1 Tax=Fervidibacillus halotolerans TaxID=2980027 RepID=A0A9E8S0G0_9BACI|nr:PH domain-containing protein [Fervidibacillus halotolerans]WAA12557.1 PH domain-containing protein [Fervidibacillus halotolerans]